MFQSIKWMLAFRFIALVAGCLSGISYGSSTPNEGADLGFHVAWVLLLVMSVIELIQIVFMRNRSVVGRWKWDIHLLDKRARLVNWSFFGVLNLVTGTAMWLTYFGKRGNAQNTGIFFIIVGISEIVGSSIAEWLQRKRGKLQ